MAEQNTNKSRTDIHWDRRALEESDEARVNIADTVQRDLELDFIFSSLQSDDTILEVGCGNGFVTNQLRERVRYVDAFDYARNMVDRARRSYGERNNRFFDASVLNRSACAEDHYDAVLCCRVLINLRDLEEQRQAIDNMASWLKSGGRLILVEGYRDGFDRLNRLRDRVGLSSFQPATINFYASVVEIMPILERYFDREGDFHTGMFDFLTRIVYPAIVGAEKATGPSGFHGAIQPIARAFNPNEFRELARVRGFLLRKR